MALRDRIADLWREVRYRWRNIKKWYRRDDWNKLTAFVTLVALVLILMWCTVPARSGTIELSDGEWVTIDGEMKYFSRVWDDGRRFTIDIYVQPEMDRMLMRTTCEWWANGNRNNPVQVVQNTAPIPPRVLYWMEKRIGKHLDRLEAEGVYTRPE